MIAPQVIHEIQRLLEREELSHRKIAARLGVSRGTVNAVADGSHARRDVCRRQRPDRFDPPHGPPRRCPVCGRLVQMPCLACHLQKLTAKRATSPRDPRTRPEPGFLVKR
ncbi:MAG TPA: hypothetical protein VJL29_02695 [Thermoguttaceae bacterium]|nr:hypothetical protein [Thermoguttaceae bacterium]